MDTLHLFIAVTLALITTAQGVSSCTNGSFELIQDPDDTRIVGYVQYCFRGEWGRLCREGGHTTLWDVSEAAVACRQLGYTSTGYAYVNQCDNTWTGGFVGVNCMNGLESSLEDCIPERENGFICDCANHARLRCEPADCSNGTPRLVGGSTDREGRVEVCVGGRWGTVQTSNSLEVAETVCRSQSQILNFYSTSPSYVSQFGYSLSKPVYSCSLNTNGGLECLNSMIPDDHTRDLGVSCESVQNMMTCSDHQSGQFRLVDGRSHNEGRLEVCVGGQWRGVSTTSLSNTTAGEICTRLGFSGDGPTAMSFELTRGDVYCCNAELHCTHCNSNGTMNNRLNCSAQEKMLDGASVAAAIVVLVLAMATGCIVTCAVVVWKRISTRKNRIKRSAPGATIATTANESYSFQQVQDEQLYSEATPVTHNYSTTGLNHEGVTIHPPVIDTYDVIGHNQPRLNEGKAANPPPVRNEAIENQDDFHNAEQHLYAAVNKKTKKTSPDESPYDKTFTKEKDTTAMLEGGEYSKLRQ